MTATLHIPARRIGRTWTWRQRAAAVIADTLAKLPAAALREVRPLFCANCGFAWQVWRQERAKALRPALPGPVDQRPTRSAPLFLINEAKECPCVTC